MQPMPILTPLYTKLFLGSNLLGAAHDLPAEAYPHGCLDPSNINVKVWVHSSNLFCCVENCTFSFSTQLEDASIEWKSYKWSSYSLHNSQ